ncbi:MAG: hypothetical protein MI673_04515, partial [Thiotrichales bacterium]|nr:hypothetical protein [Thiotrichales bacterium]
MCTAPVRGETVILPSPGEPDLTGTDGILDTLYGLDKLTRIPDLVDQWWLLTDQVEVEAVAKHAAFDQLFGYIKPDDTFVSILDVPFLDDQSASFDLQDSGSPIRFGLDPSGAPVWSSRVDDNSDL